jgi:hypothetical protein
MKKHHVLAMVGTLALLVNLLVPGLSFAAGEGQEGTATLTCLTDVPTFSIRPDTAFAFTETGDEASPGNLYSKLTDQQAFKDPAGALTLGADQANGNDFIQVEDKRDPADSGDCNTGLRVEVVEDGTTFVGTNTSQTLPLTGVYVVSDPTACAGGSVLNAVCLAAGAKCGKGFNTPVDTCADADEGVAPTDAPNTSFATWATFTGVNKAMDSAKVILRFDQTAELLGKAGVATSFAVNIPGGKPADVYTLGLTYTVYNTAT